jgi:hypothetical protein
MERDEPIRRASDPPDGGSRVGLKGATLARLPDE